MAFHEIVERLGNNRTISALSPSGFMVQMFKEIDGSNTCAIISFAAKNLCQQTISAVSPGNFPKISLHRDL